MAKVRRAGNTLRHRLSTQGSANHSNPEEATARQGA
jgi:hypothetical protein